MQSQDNCNLIDKSWILSTFHDSWTIILWEKELPAIFELSDSIHRSCHTDGQINIWWANEPRRNKKPPVFGKRRRSRGTNVENYSKWPTPIWISVYWHFMYIYIYHMLWFVSMTPLSHCILKQLLVNHINCKDITDYTQSYHSRKATRQPTHFYNSKGTVGGEWNLTRHIGRVEYNEHGHRAGGQTRSRTEVIVGPRPPLIQLSTDIRGSWIKGGLGSSPFAPILCLAYCDGNL